MKKILLTICSALALTFGFGQTATNFTVNDCAANSHTLFTELDAGKVIVMCWVMPCGACISSASADATAVQSFATSNPGRVKFYILDDTGGTTCSSLTSWESTNSITPDATIQNVGNAIKMTDYGTSGMPKTVVLGGTNHTVFYNVNGTVSPSALQTAITSGLNATTAIQEAPELTDLNVFPNPAESSTQVSFSLTSSSDDVTIDIFNMVGKKIKTVFSGPEASGTYNIPVDCTDLQNGFYFIKINTGNLEKTVIFSVSH